MAGRADSDMALVIRMLFQITHFMRAGLGDLIFLIQISIQMESTGKGF